MGEKKNNVYWTNEEKELLRKICGETQNLQELKVKTKDLFPQHTSWESIRNQVHRHSEWIGHFLKKEVKKEIIFDEHKKSDDSVSLSEIKDEKVNEIIESEEETNNSEKTEEPKSKDKNISAEDEVLKTLLKGPMSITAISEKLNIAKENVWPLLDKFRGRGYEVVEEGRCVYVKKEPTVGRVTKLPTLTKSEVKILILSDLGIGLKTHQMDLLATAYAIGEAEGVFFAIVMDISAGKPKKGKEGEHISELWYFEDQLNYIINYFPKASFNTYILNGPRDLSHMDKNNPRDMASAIGFKRDDLRYLGDLQATIEVKNVRLAVNHVNSDASVYTKSYALQGIIENYQEAVDHVFSDADNPDIALLGGIHTIIDAPPRLSLSKDRQNNIYGFAVPSLHTITTSQMIRKRRGGSPVLGCLILTLEFNTDGSLKDVTPDCIDLTAYTKPKDFLDDIEFQLDLIEDEKKILNLLAKDARTKGDLSRRLNKAIPYIEECVVNLQKRNYMIVFSESEKKYKIIRQIKTHLTPISADTLFVKKAKVASMSDIHIGADHSRPDLVPVGYQKAEEENVDKVLNSGDTFDGDGAFKGHSRTLTEHGADAQRDKGLEVFPKSKIPTEFITGSSHELAYWHQSGHNIVETFCAYGKMQGKKFKYIGVKGNSNKGFTKINGIGFQLVHPKGGIPYGKSYRLQNRIEQLVTVLDENSEEKVLLCGHLHVAIFMMYKGIAGFLVPCLEEETEYLTGGGHIPWLGMWIITVWQDAKGNITRVKPKYIAFEPNNNK